MAEENSKQFKDEICRHFDVVAEDLKSGIKQVAEGVSLNSERIETIQETLNQHGKKLESIEVNIEAIKLDIEFIKHNLKKKVDYDEHAALERRVSLLESKLDQK